MSKRKKPTVSAREQTIQLTPDEQLAFWQSLHAPTKLTPAQKRLGAIMRGTKWAESLCSVSDMSHDRRQG